MPTNNKNFIVFIIVAGIILLGYQMFIIEPQAKRAAGERAKAAAVAAAPAAQVQPVVKVVTIPQALAQSPRVAIDTPGLAGSISLKGARLDDLELKGYHEEVSRTSPLVRLLTPQGADNAYFAFQGWVGANLSGMPDQNTTWTLVTPGALTPSHPIALTYRSPGGLTFSRVISVDSQSMFTVTDQVVNNGAAPATVAPFASAERDGLPNTLSKSSIVHEGAIGLLGEDKLSLVQPSYKAWKSDGQKATPPASGLSSAAGQVSNGGWFGITDKYWMTAFIPPQTEHITAHLRMSDKDSPDDVYDAIYLGASRPLSPGDKTVETTRIFAGAKTVQVLDHYKASLGIPRFDDAVDWGILWFLTKPIFTLLEYFYRQVGNVGVAILMVTVVIRLITFPLANRGYEMGVKMKKIQPELQAMQKKLKNDPAAQQKEMMALYQREKVNPVTGCLPLLLQIPIFYALTKMFTVTIEMRHAPFFGWIHDLSARDPTTIVNLFGLIPWDPSTAPLIGALLGGMLHLGVWPIAYGVSIFLSTAMTPMQGMDPTQQTMYRFMPIIFTFIMAQYAVGLLIYWTWSSLITILQQYLLMRRFKVDNPIDDFFGRFGAKAAGTG
ncbi:MAG TPA: membrane protein insertase YidC [Caulobacteraceae bacterium]|jgi:YidC/Oxa1 family membrane protein insertase